MTATLTPNYHPHEAVLARYAAGNLREGQTLLVAAHLALCPHCRQHLQGFEAKAGINLEDMPPEDLNAACLENLLQKIDEHGPPACIDVTIPVTPIAAPSIVPEPLREFTGTHLLAGQWVVHEEGYALYNPKKILPRGIELYRFTPGGAIHLHGDKMLLILQGEIKTLLHTHGPGDIVKNNWLPTAGRKARTELIGLIG